MASLTVENYLKAIYQISHRSDQPATTGEVAQALGVSPGTVTSMLKTLDEGGRARYMPYEGVRLTPAGNALALRVVRRHRLIELFLVKTLDLAWDEVHEEAENMEHAVSELLIDRIDSFLGHPKSDPHGDPIPSAEGSIENPASRSLAECKTGEGFEQARVLDQSPEFLRYLTDAGLPLGSRGKVVSNRAESGVVEASIGSRVTTLGHHVAEKLLVK